MTKSDRISVNDLQGKIGDAIAVANNDRDPNRMEKLMPLLESAHATCLDMLGKYPPVEFH